MEAVLLSRERSTNLDPGDAVPMGDPSEARDRELVRAIGRGNEEAFRGLFRRYAPSGMAVARRVLGQTYLAEEAVQEAFLALWRNPHTYREMRGSVKAWIMATVHNRAVDLVRREEAQRHRTEDAGDEGLIMAEDPAGQVVDEIGLPEERKAVRAALEDLPPEQREIIELMYFDGLSQTTIAGRLSVPLGTVKSRTLLGMRKLRTALGGMER